MQTVQQDLAREYADIQLFAIEESKKDTPVERFKQRKVKTKEKS